MSDKPMRDLRGMAREMAKRSIVTEATARLVEQVLVEANEYHEARISELERALWAALQGREVVISADTPRDIEWKTLDDGERLARRKWKPK